MKLVIIVTHEDSALDVQEALIKKKYSLTQIESTGGFLNKKNTTFFTAVKEKNVDEVVEVVKKNAKTQEETIAAPLFSGMDVEGMLSSSATATVTVGGATIFILPLDKIIKV